MIRAIVTDIEGTTSSLAFVKDVLFPYARRHLAPFIRAHANAPEVAALLAAARTVADLASDAPLTALIATLERWIDEDRKITPLKSLQGLIWQAGYRDGAFQGHIYPDAAVQLQQWQQQGIALYVYSSGSVAAQKLLFGHTAAGDLTPLFSGYFDTQIGAKQERAAYQQIATTLAIPATEILFLSDVTAELDAAAACGFATCQLLREGVVAEAQPRHRQAVDFHAVAALLAPQSESAGA